MTYTRPLSKDEALDIIERAIQRARTRFLCQVPPFDLKAINSCLQPLRDALKEARTDELLLPKGIITSNGVEIARTPGYCDGRPCTCTANLQP